MTDRRDPLAEEEAAAAAAEAAAIGGTPTRDLETDVDEAMRAVIEGGGGEAEGFELAEQELIEHAEQGPARPGAEVHVREEIDRETEEVDRAVYGEADQVDVTEVGHDPDPDPHDDPTPPAPGIDPHTAHDK
jgi:hypothetical protein